MSTNPSSSMITLTYIMYVLHLFSAINGVITTVAVVTAFLTGWPSIIAIIINYLQRDQVRGTYLEGHFQLQATTFWYALIMVMVGILIFITVIGIPVAWVMFWLIGIWVLYRMITGLMRLVDGRPAPV